MVVFDSTNSDPFSKNMASIIGNFVKAKHLVGKPNSSLYLMTQVLHVPLPCEYLGDVNGAMMLLLNEELKIFSAELQGVPVAFNEKSARLMEESGSMVSAQAYTHCNLQSEFVVFKPKVGDVLNCVVNKVTPSSFGCLVHSCFYATIHRKSSEDKRILNIKVGSKIQLMVTKLEEDGNGVLSITGEIHRRQKKHSTHPPDAVDDSGIDNSDFASDYTCTTSAQDESLLNASVEAPYQSDHDAVFLSDSLLNGQNTNQGSGNKIYRDPESIKNASTTACCSADINALKQTYGGEGTTMTTSEDTGSGTKTKKKKLKKEKKHKKRKKESKDKRKPKAGKLDIQKPEDSLSVSHIPGGNLDGDHGKDKNAAAAASPDVVTALNGDNFFSPSSKGMKSAIRQSQTSANANVEKKSSKKRKKDMSERFTSSPPIKRAALENPSMFPPERFSPTNEEKNSNVGEVSEHEQQALYHLQKLGINLPLSLLKSGLLSSPILSGESTLGATAGSSEHPKKKSRKTEKFAHHTAVSEPSIIENESPHLENVSSYLKTKEAESVLPWNVRTTTTKDNKKPSGMLKNAESVSDINAVCLSSTSIEMDSRHHSLTSHSLAFNAEDTLNAMHSQECKKKKKKKKKEKKRKTL